MPIDYKKYPPEWKTMREMILRRAENKCELCDAENYKPHWKTGSKVILTIHHIDYDIDNMHIRNLIALCQRCHLRLDEPLKLKKRKKSRK